MAGSQLIAPGFIEHLHFLPVNLLTHRCAPNIKKATAKSGFFIIKI